MSGAVVSMDTQQIFFNKILNKIERCGLDCAGFRESYIKRRISNRLRTTGCPDFLSYYRYIDKHPDEYRFLLDALTVNVTEFFRDTSVYRLLETSVIPAIIETRAARGPGYIRLWSAGCSSGEETYSLAMMVANCLAKKGIGFIKCSIYGTDVDNDSLRKAKAGVYSASEIENIPQEYRKFLVPYHAASFHFTPEIRSMVRFKKLDLFVDKTLKHMDAIFCRNVMIYFGREKQGELIGRFGRSIIPGGYLTIGKSEKLQDRTGAFTAVDSRCRIYRRLAG